MCIIVAKPAGIKMPTNEILSNCFTNNPDGAGIMLSAKGKVWGFKGLMTFDALTARLKKLQKTFGDLDKLPVVLHFRIGTHGANIAANTHPFPVAASYKVMRRLEWTGDLGMAHNGIIQALSSHPDIKAQNVSDTMAFIRHVVTPISKVCALMKNDRVLDAMQLTSGSRLAFLDAKGTLKVLGDFVVSEGVFYSNTTYEAPRYKPYGLHDYGWADWEGWFPKDKAKKRGEKPRLSRDDENYLMGSLAFEYGLTRLGSNITICCPDYEVPGSSIEYALDEGDGTLCYWNEDDYDWVPSSFSDEYVDLLLEGEERDS